MEISLLCVLIYAMWTMVPLIFGIGAYRVGSVLTGRAANSFPADAPHEGPDWYHRMNRVHLNCVENLPVYACVVFVGVGLDIEATLWVPVTVAVLVCRVLQSLIHMISTSPMAINARFSFFVGQLVGLMVLSGCIVQHVLAPS